MTLHVVIPGESETVIALAGRARGDARAEALLRDVDALFGRRVAEVAL